MRFFAAEREKRYPAGGREEVNESCIANGTKKSVVAVNGARRRSNAASKN